MRNATRGGAGLAGALAVIFGLSGGSALGQTTEEITLKNDTLAAGGTAAVCPCFVATEEAAVWLTSPCDGNIVALQVFWLSQFGGAQQTVEDAIIVYQGGTFPQPGLIKDVLLAPVMTDGGLNEYRFRDDNMAIPISIPVAENEEFVVSFRFFNDNAGNLFAASLASDANGCQQGKNAVKVSSGLWQNACTLGVSGDWIIRAVVACPSCVPDINGDGNLNNADINAFVSAFIAMDPAADLNADGNFNNTDINDFIFAFIQGCG